MSSRRNVILGFAGLAAATMLAQSKTATVTRAGTAFGTIVKLTVTAKSEIAANNAIDAGFAKIRAVHQAADLFLEASEITRLNGSGKLVQPSTLFRNLVAQADALHKITYGAFDATVQPLWKLWSQCKTQPDATTLAHALSRVSWKNVHKRDDTIELRKNAELTFNGIAQGYAADLVMKEVRRHGALSAVIDTGETATFNAVEGLEIQHPRQPTALGTLRIDTGFVAVSGDYSSTFSDDFRNHHIINPATGFSPLELASVIVVAPTGAMADGLATAFMVMGKDKALACLSSLEDCAALFVDKAGRRELSVKMKPLFKTLAA